MHLSLAERVGLAFYRGRGPLLQLDFVVVQTSWGKTMGQFFREDPPVVLVLHRKGGVSLLPWHFNGPFCGHRGFVQARRGYDSGFGDLGDSVGPFWEVFRPLLQFRVLILQFLLLTCS
jgi:hypothetical protein